MYYHDDSCLTDQDGITSEKNRYDIISSLYSAPVLSTKKCICIIIEQLKIQFSVRCSKLLLYLNP